MLSSDLKFNPKDSFEVTTAIPLKYMDIDNRLSSITMSIAVIVWISAYKNNMKLSIF